MLRDAYNNIVNGIDVKESLLEIKDSLKSAERGSRTKDALLLMIKDDFSVFYELLKNSDPKIRKNTAIVLGVLGNKDSVDKLYVAYKKEDVMYNMASYVEAIRKIDHTKYVEELKARFNELKKTPLTSDNKKHILEEMKQLKSIFGTGKQEFIGYDLVNECILTTNRNYKDITAAALKNIPHKDFTAGVIVKTDKLRQVLPIRTYDEILFIPDKVKTVTNDPIKAAGELVNGGIKEYIFDRIGITGDRTGQDDNIKVNFRTDLRLKGKKENNDFVKKFSSELEALTNWELSNSVSDYALEIRLIEGTSGKLNVLIKFNILKDVRFTYRKDTIAAGIKPYLAATLMQLASPYLKGNTTVLDPFCGTGTLLAERELVANARMYYGIDIFGEAIEKAKSNLKSFGLLKKTELINKDFFNFEHAYKFDEIVTDMPFVTENKSLKDIENIYASFFDKIDGLLEKKAVVVLYSRNPEFVKKYYIKSGCSIAEDFEISKFENAHLFVLTR